MQMDKYDVYEIIAFIYRDHKTTYILVKILQKYIFKVVYYNTTDLTSNLSKKIDLRVRIAKLSILGFKSLQIMLCLNYSIQVL